MTSHTEGNRQAINKHKLTDLGFSHRIFEGFERSVRDVQQSYRSTWNLSPNSPPPHEDPDSRSRGAGKNLIKQRRRLAAILHIFGDRLVNECNNLARGAVEIRTIELFKVELRGLKYFTMCAFQRRQRNSRHCKPVWRGHGAAVLSLPVWDELFFLYHTFAAETRLLGR